MRTFFAIALTGAARTEAEALLAALRAAPDSDAVRWARAEGLHVTLRFLGEIDAGQVQPVARAVAEEMAGCAPFELALGGVRGFPTPRRPRVVACEVAPVDAVTRLAAAVERGTARAGFAPEARSFRAHLTLGRVRRGRSVQVPALAASAAARMRVDEIVFFQSELSRSGARYSPLEHVALEATLTPDSNSNEK